ncbi:hypothetical protein GCM10011504_57110 [Siccirubricoccus deserti]|nr:hypothetical protein GCM10011504_57110 [Siccirubricoccus deserti]
MPAGSRHSHGGSYQRFISELEAPVQGGVAAVAEAVAVDARRTAGAVASWQSRVVPGS